jgi:hypothetical protein
MVRRQFAFDERRVPMNAANLCPSPRNKLATPLSGRHVSATILKMQLFCS